MFCSARERCFLCAKEECVIESDESDVALLLCPISKFRIPMVVDSKIFCLVVVVDDVVVVVVVVTVITVVNVVVVAVVVVVFVYLDVVVLKVVLVMGRQCWRNCHCYRYCSFVTKFFNKLIL